MCALERSEKGMEFKMNTKIYNILKWISQIFLPAIGTLYFTISVIWKLPYADHLIGTLAAIDTFLGALLMIKAPATPVVEESAEVMVLTPEMDEELSNGKGDDTNE